MQQIDLDDLPPRVARMFESLNGEDELVVTRGGLVVVRLNVVLMGSPAQSVLAPETDMADVMEHFGAIIEDEF